MSEYVDVNGAAICGDLGGPHPVRCTLSPGHTGDHQTTVFPLGTESWSADDSTAPAPEPTTAVLLEEIKALRSELAGVVEFVDVLKNVGAQAAKGNGMQAMMLRNMVPGIELLGGQ